MNPFLRPTNSTPGRKRRSRSLLVPRTSIAQAAPSRAFTGSTQLGGQVLFGDLLDEFRLEAFAEDRNLGDGDLVEPRLDERPDGGEEVGGLEGSSSSVSWSSWVFIRIVTHVDDVKLAHYLGVYQRVSNKPTVHSQSQARPPKLTVVLPDSTSGRNVILDLVERADPSPVQVHDRATRLDQVTLSVGTRGQTLTQKLFVLADEVLELTFLGGECVELVDIELAELFDVDRSAVLRGSRGSRNVSRRADIALASMLSAPRLTLSVRW